MTIEELNRLSANSFVEKLGIRFLDFDGNSITAEIDITSSHLQPYGYVHGGVYLAFAETLAGAGSILLVYKDQKTAFGSHVSAQHISSVKEGRITGTGRLIHKGIFKHVWDIEITGEDGKLISLCRVSNSIKSTEPGKDVGGNRDDR